MSFPLAAEAPYPPPLLVPDYAESQAAIGNVVATEVASVASARVREGQKVVRAYFGSFGQRVSHGSRPPELPWPKQSVRGFFHQMASPKVTKTDGAPCSVAVPSLKNGFVGFVWE